jgi:hypothetical protein
MFHVSPESIVMRVRLFEEPTLRLRFYYYTDSLAKTIEVFTSDEEFAVIRPDDDSPGWDDAIKLKYDALFKVAVELLSRPVGTRGVLTGNFLLQ